jgi:CRP-like cAMP-binding protein
LPRFPSAADEDALPRFPSAPDEEELPRYEREDSDLESTGPYASPPPSVAESIPDYEPEFQVPPFPPEAVFPPEPVTHPRTGSMPEMVAEGALLTSEAPPAAEPEARIDNVALADVLGLQDLPPEAQRALVESARVERLENEEEVGAFAVALVLEGSVALMPTIADAACARARQGDVVFTAGTLEEGIALRVVAADDGALVAIWNKSDWEQVTADCPWVADELRGVADEFQALAGAAMGALGDRFDETMRAMVTDRCEVKTLLPGEILVESGSTVPGIHIVGGGHVEIVDGEGESATVLEELGPGEFLFAAQVLGAGNATHTARAGSSGALILCADRMTAHELLVSVPPLIEILAG